ncbi:MAG: imidazolonepropionase, partial [Gemmatimonadetes bacterium]|nr:imidazolonepropionase [Gemmatimonadota bacterium]
AAVAVEGETIREAGAAGELAERYERAVRADCAGGVLAPGFIDSHTHAVFGGWRAAEYGLRSRGVPYMEIARRGGGINASIRDVRTLSEEQLLALAVPRLERLLDYGTTTVEVKSGYGLSLAAELKQLRVARALGECTAVEIRRTFLGAHEFPPEYRERHEEYVTLVIREMIPAVAREGLADFCDVFCEPGVFTPAQTRRILEAGRAHGLIPKLHADELENSGGAELAVALDAASADHLGAISAAGVAALAASSETVATLLPATLLSLGKTSYAPARRLLDAGATVALATDFNPGSSPTPNMPLVMTIACSQLGMDPLEALCAATAAGARALRLGGGQGTITAGAPADLVCWDVPDYCEIAYRFGDTPVRGVWKRGRQVRPRL